MWSGWVSSPGSRRGRSKSAAWRCLLDVRQTDCAVRNAPASSAELGTGIVTVADPPALLPLRLARIVLM